MYVNEKDDGNEKESDYLDDGYNDREGAEDITVLNNRLSTLANENLKVVSKVKRRTENQKTNRHQKRRKTQETQKRNAVSRKKTRF